MHATKTLSATSPETELEAAAVDAEELACELDAHGGPGAALFARGLRRIARDARMSLVAEADAATATRLHLRLETTIRLASAALLEAAVERSSDGPPASQRPTTPPPPFLSPNEIWRRMPPSERSSGSAVRRRFGAPGVETAETQAPTNRPPRPLRSVRVRREK